MAVAGRETQPAGMSAKDMIASVPADPWDPTLILIQKLRGRYHLLTRVDRVPGGTFYQEFLLVFRNGTRDTKGLQIFRHVQEDNTFRSLAQAVRADGAPSQPPVEELDETGRLIAAIGWAAKARQYEDVAKRFESLIEVVQDYQGRAEQAHEIEASYLPDGKERVTVEDIQAIVDRLIQKHTPHPRSKAT